MAGAAATPLPVLVDAHVHIHPCFDLPRFLDAAARNAAAALPGRPPDAAALMLLADFDDSHGFERLLERGRAGDWTLSATSEPETVVASRDARRLVFIAGAQVRTAERLEVLALATRWSCPDGLPIADVVAAAQDAGGIAVVPWGFGKWSGRRGAIVADLLREAPPPFAGDNGGRLRAGPLPRLLRQARAAGVPVLPGSDPLPFGDHEQRAGSCGLLADVAIEEQPAAALRAWLRRLGTQPPMYGGGRGLIEFARDQLRMQVRKRRR
jgi:hypothetical protein